MNVEESPQSPILPGSRYKHRTKNLPDSPLIVGTARNLIPLPKAIRIVNHILQHPRSFDEGNRGRELILQSFQKYFGPFTEKSSNNDYQLLINQTMRWYDHHVFENLLYKDLIRREALDRDMIMKTAPSFAFQQRTKQFFISYCTIQFDSIERMIESYQMISEKWPKIMGGYFENFAHFCLYVIEHEIAHSLWLRIHTHIADNDLHNKLFWNILHSFSGQNIAHSLANMYFYARPDVEMIKHAGENPVYSKNFFKKILKGIHDHGMNSSRDREELAQEIFNAIIALREIHDP